MAIPRKKAKKKSEARKTEAAQEEKTAAAKSAPAQITLAQAASHGKRVCIVCEQEKEGVAVKDDVVINSIRKLKKALGIATNNRLVVCSECAAKHKENRSRFEKTLVQYIAFAAILLAVLVGLPLVIGGQFSLGSVVVGILIGIFIVALSITRYVPATETGGGV